MLIIILVIALRDKDNSGNNPEPSPPTPPTPPLPIPEGYNIYSVDQTNITNSSFLITGVLMANNAPQTNL